MWQMTLAEIRVQCQTLCFFGSDDSQAEDLFNSNDVCRESARLPGIQSLKFHRLPGAIVSTTGVYDQHANKQGTGLRPSWKSWLASPDPAPRKPCTLLEHESAPKSSKCSARSFTFWLLNYAIRIGRKAVAAASVLSLRCGRLLSKARTHHAQYQQARVSRRPGSWAPWKFSLMHIQNRPNRFLRQVLGRFRSMTS